jgi:hypothetical protein
MTMTFKLIRGFPAFDLEELARALRNSFDPRIEIRQFQMRLRGAVRARQHELNATSANLRFAVDELLPFRLRGIERHVQVNAVDSHAFSDFLSYILEVARAQIGTSATVDDLAETIVDVLDDLHGYVLAHELVAPGYLAAERDFARRLMSAGDNAPAPRNAEDADHSRVIVDASIDDLVLAA